MLHSTRLLTILYIFDHNSSRYPCAESYDALGIEADQCDAIYDFRHRLNLTNDTDEIKVRKLFAYCSLKTIMYLSIFTLWL